MQCGATTLWKTTFGRVEKHINILVNDDVRNLGDPRPLESRGSEQILFEKHAKMDKFDFEAVLGRNLPITHKTYSLTLCHQH